VLGLTVVALLSLAFAGYTVLTPHGVTVTQQQFLTNMQSLTLVQTQTVTSTLTSATTVTATSQYGYVNGQYQVCSYYGCYPSSGYYPGYYYGYAQITACQPTSSNNNVNCSGWLYQANNGCTLLAIPTTSNPYPSYATGNVYEYYTLHNLPSNAPQSGAWITVNGQLYQGYNTASNGASCPNNYIIVSSIS